MGVLLLSIGLVCLLVGLFILRWALQGLIGYKTENILTKMTNSPFTGVVAGVVLTTVLQSSSIVLIVVLNLVSIGALPILNAVAIVLGANLGTSMTLEFIAFSNPNWIAILLLVAMILFLLKKRLHGAVPGALALLLIGFYFLKQNAVILSSLPIGNFTGSSLLDYSLSLFYGIVFTGIIQSSTASTTFVMSLADTHILSLTNGILFVYGSNIGTCITAIIAVIGASIHAKKIMLYHVFINIVCVLVLLPFVPLFAIFLEYITVDPVKQIAHSQVLFNFLTIVMFYPFIKQHTRLLNKLV